MTQFEITDELKDQFNDDGVVVVSSSFIELCRLMTPRWLMALFILKPVAMDDSTQRRRTQGDDMNIII